MDLSTPPEIPGFRLLHSIGSGAYGVVWLGQDVVLGVYRAIKVVWLVHDSDSTQIERISRRRRAERVLRGLQEYLQRVSVLSFPAIAVLELKVDPEGRFFHYTMPLADDARTGRELNPLEQPLEGYRPRTLSSVCAEESAGHLPVKAVVRIGTRLAEALSELHEAGIVHQDIKPSNIIFLRGEPTFADVDLVRDLDATRTIAGTAGYVPPEGTGSVGADIYSLGKTLYVIATGQSAQTNCLTPAGDWDRSVDAVALVNLMEIWSRACEDSSTRRHATARELADELRLMEAGRSIQQLRRLEHFKMRYQRIVLGGIPLLIALVGLTVFLQRQSDTQSFALYQASMAKAVAGVLQGRFGLARDALLDSSIPPTLRGPEWHALWYQTKYSSTVQISHPTNTIDRLMFDPAGNQLAVETGKSTYVHLLGYEYVRPNVVRPFPGGKKTLNHLKVIGGWVDSNQIIGVGGPGELNTLRVWDVRDPTQARQLLLDPNWIYGPRSRLGVYAVMTNAASGVIGIASCEHPSAFRWIQWGTPPPDCEVKRPLVDNAGTILLQHVETGILDTYTSHLFIKNLTNDTPAIHEVYPLLDIKAIDLSHDGTRFAYSETRTGELTLRSGKNFENTRQQSFNAIHSLAFSPDGTRLASAGDDEHVRIHDVQTLQVLKEFQGHVARITALAWSEDGKRLASGDASGEVRVWVVASASIELDVVSGLKSGGSNPFIAIQPWAGRLAVSGANRSTTILSCDDLRSLTQLTNGHLPLAFEGDQIWLLAHATNSRSIAVLQSIAPGGRYLHQFPTLTPNLFGYWSDASNYGLLHDSFNRVAFTKLPPSESVFLPQHHGGEYIQDAAISPDGTRAVTVGDNRATFWKVPSGERQLLQLTNKFYCAGFVNSRGSQCLFGSDSFTVYMVSVDENRVSSIQTRIEQNFAIVIDQASDRFYTGGASGRIHVGRLSDGKPLVVLEHPELLQRKGEHRIRRLAYNPVLKDLYAITDGGILARWRMAPVEPE